MWPELANPMNQFVDSLETLREYITSIQTSLDQQREEFFDERVEHLKFLSTIFDKMNERGFFDHDRPFDQSVRVDYEDNKISAIAETTGETIHLEFRGVDPHSAEVIPMTMRNIIQHVEKVNLLYHSALVSLTSFFEFLISNVIRVHLMEHPEMVTSSKKSLTLKEIQELGSLDAARDFIIEREIENTLRDNFDAWVQYLRSQAGLSMGYVSEHQDQVCEIFQRRNIFVHNGGIANPIYFAKVKPSLRQGIKLGESVSVTKDYLFKSINAIEKIGLLIGAELWKKVRKSDEGRGKILSDIGFNHLTQENWEVAGAVCHFIMVDSTLPESQRLSNTINYWQAMKWSGRFDDIESDIRSMDLSAKAPIFKLARLALLDDFDQFFDLLPACLNTDISLREFETWPLFKSVRKDPRAQEFLIRTVENQSASAQENTSVAFVDQATVSNDFVWVNIDKPRKRFTVHGTLCKYVDQSEETKNKGLGSLKRDGGWLPFDSHEEAMEIHKVQFSNYTIIHHC